MVLAGVQKTVFEGPVLRQMIPAIVLQEPSIMTQAAHFDSGKRLGIEGGDPKPFMRGLFRFLLTLAVMVHRAGQPASVSTLCRVRHSRHTFATEMLRAGVSLPALKELLGHRDIRMTMV